MAIFVDTSGILALLNDTDRWHGQARAFWLEAGSRAEELVTTSYVQLETWSLLQRRMGIPGVEAFERDIVPVLRIDWTDHEQHLTGVEAVMTAGRRDLSLVDCVSFAAMQRLGLQTVFAFDPHFEERGFTRLP